MYSYQDKVRYSEVDRFGKLSVQGIVNHMQNCCTMQSEDLGLGVEFLKQRKRVWVLNSWQIDFLEEIKLEDEIQVGTWPYGNKGIYAYRNFYITTPDGKPLVKTNSLWIYVNTETGMPERVLPEEIDPYGKEPKLDMEYLERKIKVEGEEQEQEPFSVRKYHIDTNNHVDNSWYLQFAMEYLPDNFEEANCRIKRLRAEYKNSAVYGDVIYPVVYRQENKMIVSLNDVAGKAYCVVELIY